MDGTATVYLWSKTLKYVSNSYLHPPIVVFFFASRFCFAFYIPVGTAATAVAFIVQYPSDATPSLTLDTPVDDSHGVPLTSNSCVSEYDIFRCIYYFYQYYYYYYYRNCYKHKNNYLNIFKFRKCVFHEPWKTGSAVVAEVINDIIAVANTR